ncbi:MAG: hypothetical protein P4M09_16805 [Devosia sp.]|nr:hypothetical protein [Devosia sp.]
MLIATLTKSALATTLNDGIVASPEDKSSYLDGAAGTGAWDDGATTIGNVTAPITAAMFAAGFNAVILKAEAKCWVAIEDSGNIPGTLRKIYALDLGETVRMLLQRGDLVLTVQTRT